MYPHLTPGSDSHLASGTLMSYYLRLATRRYLRVYLEHDTSLLVTLLFFVEFPMSRDAILGRFILV